MEKNILTIKTDDWDSEYHDLYIHKTDNNVNEKKKTCVFSVKELRSYIQKKAEAVRENLAPLRDLDELEICYDGDGEGGRFVCEFAFINNIDRRWPCPTTTLTRTPTSNSARWPCPIYNYNESSDYEFGELALSNCDSNENADEELGEMTLSDYNSNEDADFDCGEKTLSDYDFNETADYELSESEDEHNLISHL